MDYREKTEEYTILTFCNGRKLCVKNNTPQSHQTLDEKFKECQEDNVLWALHSYLITNSDHNKYTKEELTEKLFEGIDKHGLLKFMYMIFDADFQIIGTLEGADFRAIPYTPDTLFEVTEER